MKSNKIKKLNEIITISNGYISAKELNKAGLSSYDILRFIELGYIDRVKRGLYRKSNVNDEYNEMVEVSKIVPNGFICLLSALAYYELTTYIPSEYQVAVHMDAHKTKLPGYPPIKLYFFSDDRFSTGVSNIKISGSTVNIYDIEKTLCDCIFYRNKIGTDIVKEALDNYIKRKGNNIQRLLEYAEKLRVKSTLKTYLEVLI
jgi:predicted transcriptional regulator of viral defense system